MIMAAKLTYLYDLTTTISSNLTVDQIISTMIFGSSGIAGVYNPEHVYHEGDLATYVDSNGVIHVYQCIAEETTGEIDLEDWEEFSILKSISNTSNNLILLSTLAPVEEGNKVWLEYRGGGGGIPDRNYGLIVKKNFILSVNEPEDFTSDLVWGRIQVG